ncbi:MAG: pyrroline-5-carboxylate reductase [Bryobacteraceae bacterium]
MAHRIAVLGAGNMGAALLGGILKGVATPDRVVATVRTPERAAEVASKFGIRTLTADNRAAVECSDILIFAVKPATLPKVLAEVRDALREDQILVSLAAAVPISLIEQVAGKHLPIFRAMPNIPVVVEEGATAIASNTHCTLEHRSIVESIFRAVGVAVFVDEELMHAVTALSGSGPAYIYMVIEAMIAGGLKMGLSREIATRLSEQTVLGAAKLVRETALHPAVLRDQVITPGGVTISAIHELERHGLRSMLISAIETATRHSEDRMRQLLHKSKT